jgi:hypothetical protein
LLDANAEQARDSARNYVARPTRIALCMPVRMAPCA